MADRRALIPLFAAVALVGVCSWRLGTNTRQDYADQVAAALSWRPAPAFELLDADNHLVRLNTYLGRHQVVLLFFDGEAGADRDRDLLRLRERFPELSARNVKVVAISAAIPQVNRAAMDRVGSFPFPLLTDFDPLNPEGLLRVHQMYGRVSATGQPQTGVFLIDRKGQIACRVTEPMPLPSIDAAIDAALQ